MFGTYIEDRSNIDQVWPTLNADAVAMKVISRDVIHKTDMSAVRLNIGNPDQAKQTWDEIGASIHAKLPEAKIDGFLFQPMIRGKEVIIGAKRDATFGPVVVFGLGGIFVEAIKDVTMLVAPIGQDEARAMIDGIAGANYLKAFRGANLLTLGHRTPSSSPALNEHPEILRLTQPCDRNTRRSICRRRAIDEMSTSSSVIKTASKIKRQFFIKPTILKSFILSQEAVSSDQHSHQRVRRVR